MARELSVCVVGQTKELLDDLVNCLIKEHGIAVSRASGLVSDAMIRLRSIKCDIVVLNVSERYPELRGTVQRFRQLVNVPIIVIGRSTTQKAVASTAGAHDFIHYTAASHISRVKVEQEVISHIRIATAHNQLFPPKNNANDSISGHIAASQPVLPVANFRTNFRGVLALGASCGGTDAILEVVRRLPRNIPGMAVVQHMPPGFTNMYAERLNRECVVNVVEAEGQMKMETGKIILAQGDMQMRVIHKADGFYTECYNGPKVTGHKPSVDALFSSVAQCAGRNAAGIILTGMGQDGARGLLEMRRKGAYTIGQDQKSCVVYGMPKVAFDMGAVEKQVPLDQVANTLLTHLSKI